MQLLTPDAAADKAAWERSRCYAMQAYDCIMMENKPLRSYEEAEVSEDPLIMLGCGHVLPMSSTDGLVELEKAYSKDRRG